MENVTTTITIGGKKYDLADLSDDIAAKIISSAATLRKFQEQKAAAMRDYNSDIKDTKKELHKLLDLLESGQADLPLEKNA